MPCDFVIVNYCTTVNFVCTGSIDENNDDSFSAEESPTIYDPVHSFVEGNIYHNEFK